MNAPAAPRQLTVFFDGECGICRRVADWIARQPQFVPLHCVPAQTQTGAGCPLQADELLRQVTVVSDQGAVWHGTDAWITCLWALRRYRRWSLRLSRPGLRPWAERLFAVIAGLHTASLRRRHG